MRSYSGIKHITAGAEGAQPYPGTPVFFDPSVQDTRFVVYIEPMPSDEGSKLLDSTRDRKGRIDSAKFNELLCKRVLKGFTGATPEALRDCKVYPLNDAGVEAFRAELEADGVTEIPWSQTQGITFMNDSLEFSNRIQELATDVGEFNRAREAYEKKASLMRSGTGSAGGASRS